MLQKQMIPLSSVPVTVNIYFSFVVQIHHGLEIFIQEPKLLGQP